MSEFKVGDKVGLVHGIYSESKWNPFKTKGIVVEDGIPFIKVKWREGVYNEYRVDDLYLWSNENTLQVGLNSNKPNTEWTDKHYDHYYTHKLTQEEIDSGVVKLKIDPYFVNSLWGLNSVEKSGAGFHCLKTLSRMPNNKNSLSREWDAMIGQSTRARELLNK